MSEEFYNRFIGKNQQYTTEEVKDILLQRQKVLSEIVVKEDKKLVKYLNFRINGENYGVPFDYLREILKLKSITPVENTSPIIEGVINWHSKVLTVINLKKAFHISSEHSIKRPWIIITQYENIFLGLLVDSVVGDEYFDDSTLTESLSMSEGKTSKYVSGIYRGEVAMLDVKVISESLNQELNSSNLGYK